MAEIIIKLNTENVLTDEELLQLVISDGDLNEMKISMCACESSSDNPF